MSISIVVLRVVRTFCLCLYWRVISKVLGLELLYPLTLGGVFVSKSLLVVVHPFVWIASKCFCFVKSNYSTQTPYLSLLPSRRSPIISIVISHSTAFIRQPPHYNPTPQASLYSHHRRPPLLPINLPSQIDKPMATPLSYYNSLSSSLKKYLLQPSIHCYWFMS